MPIVLVALTAAIAYTPPNPGRPTTSAGKLAKLGIPVSVSAAVEAASIDDLLVLDLLREAGVDLAGADLDGTTPLASAAFHGARQATAYLIRQVPHSIDIADSAGQTPLARAVSSGQPAIIAQLTAAGADPRITLPRDRPLLVVAAGRSHAETVHALLELGATDGIDRALVTAVKTGDVLIANHLLESGADPSVEIDGGLSLIHHAIAAGERSMVELLACSGADLGATDRGGRTAIGAALDAGPELALLLAGCGADLDAPSHGSQTPLEVALERNSTKLAGALLELGAAPHPALAFAAWEQRRFAFLELLAAHGAPLDAPGPDGDRLLASAVRAPAEAFDAESTAFLLRMGCDPNARGREGQSALALAIAGGSPAAVRLLLEAGADPNATLSEPVSEAYRELLDNKTLSFYLKRDRRFTPLMIAAGLGEPDTIRALLEHGASIGRYTRSWKRYPISFASEARHIEAQQLLVGYDPRDRDEQYKIVISLSRQRATLFRNGEEIDSSPVSTGKRGYRTPAGEYVVTHKHRHHTSNLYDASMPYFMRLSCGAFGTHTGYLPGYPASHGCIRMPNSKARAFFETCPRGTPVSIVE